MSRIYIEEADIADDCRQPVDGSWEFVGLVKWAMKILSREGAGLFYCERNIERAELIVCFDEVSGACATAQ